MGTHDEYVKQAKDAGQSLGTKLVMDYLLKKVVIDGVAVFGLPFIGSVTNLAVAKVLEILIQKTEFGAFFFFIDTRTGGQKNDFKDAVQRHADAIKGGNRAQIKAAEDQLVVSFKNFVKFTT